MVKKNTMELLQYDIGLMFLEKVKEIDKDYLEIEVYDLSVTQLKYPSSTITKKIKRDGKTIVQTTYIPDIVFNLVESDNKPVSLIEVLLPNHNILCSKANLIEKESIKEIREGKEIYSKIVFDLVAFTKKSLIKTTQTYEEYQKEIDLLKTQHKTEIDGLRESYKQRMNNMLEPYKSIETALREELTKKDDEINKLMIQIPNKMNQKIRDFVLKQTN